MGVLRRARDTLETCRCQRLQEGPDQEDTDGCDRCIRAYHLQYSAERISRKRGVVLLNQLIAAGERRVQKTALADIKPDALFGSLQEKKFVETLHACVEQRQGTWEITIIKGRQGFRCALPASGRLWELAGVEYYPNQLDGDAFAELAWPELPQPVAVLVGDQATFADQWQDHGWMVVALEDIQAKGVTWFIEMVTSNMAGASRWPR